MSKKIVLWIILALGIVVGVWYVQRDNGPISNDGPVKIGIITPMTGSGAGVYHEPLKKGIDIALAEINKDGPKVEVVYEDDQLDSKLSLSAYNNLKLKGIKYYILNGSPSASVVGPEIVKEGYFSMVPSALLTSYRDSSPLTCRIALTADNYGPAFTDLLMKDMGKKNVATLISNTEGGMAIFKVFKEKFEAAGGKVVQEETFGKDDTDFRTQITKIKANKLAEAVVIINWSTTIETMLKQMKEQGLDLPIISDSPTIKNSALKNMTLANGVTFLDYSFAADDAQASDMSKNFVAQYASANNGDTPSIQAAQGYDVMKLISYALANAKDQSPSTVASYFVAKIKNYPSAGGNFSFDKSCEALRDITVRKVADGRISK